MPLKVLLHNLENFFVFVDKENPQNIDDLSENEWQKLSSSLYKNKPLQKVRELAENLLQESPDIALFTEVGGLESLENFNRYFLNSQYQCLLQNGNSDRGIELGFMLKKSGKFSYTQTSYRHLKNSRKEKVFSRDLAELILEKDSKPYLRIFLVHLKSHLDKKRVDPWGVKKRKSEVEALVKIYLEAQKKQPLPTLLAGDFNGQAGRDETSQEFIDLYHKADFEDVLEIEKQEIAQRASYFYFKGRHIFANQLDFIFLNQLARSSYQLGSAKTCPFPGHLVPPRNLRDRNKYPSDHLPLICELNLP